MEGANEAARRAVNFIIDASGVNAGKCQLWNLHEPNILKPLRNRDQKRYNQGLPYEFYVPFGLKLLEYITKFFLKLFGK